MHYSQHVYHSVRPGPSSCLLPVTWQRTSCNGNKWRAAPLVGIAYDNSSNAENFWLIPSRDFWRCKPRQQLAHTRSRDRALAVISPALNCDNQTIYKSLFMCSGKHLDQRLTNSRSQAPVWNQKAEQSSTANGQRTVRYTNLTRRTSMCVTEAIIGHGQHIQSLWAQQII